MCWSLKQPLPNHHYSLIWLKCFTSELTINLTFFLATDTVVPNNTPLGSSKRHSFSKQSVKDGLLFKLLIPHKRLSFLQSPFFIRSSAIFPNKPTLSLGDVMSGKRVPQKLTPKIIIFDLLMHCVTLRIRQGKQNYVNLDNWRFNYGWHSTQSQLLKVLAKSSSESCTFTRDQQFPGPKWNDIHFHVPDGIDKFTRCTNLSKKSRLDDDDDADVQTHEVDVGLFIILNLEGAYSCRKGAI